MNDTRRSPNSDVEVDVEDNEEEDEEQAVDDGVHAHGGYGGLHAEEVNRPALPGHRDDHPGAEEREQSRSYQGSSPVVHIKPSVSCNKQEEPKALSNLSSLQSSNREKGK